MSVSQKTIKEQIKHLGGIVYEHSQNKLPDERYQIEGWFVITTQNKLDKPASALSDVIIQAHRRKWEFLSLNYITECIIHGHDVGHDNYTLNTDRLCNTIPKTLQALRTIAPPNGLHERYVPCSGVVLSFL